MGSNVSIKNNKYGFLRSSHPSFLVLNFLSLDLLFYFSVNIFKSFSHFSHLGSVILSSFHRKLS